MPVRSFSIGKTASYATDWGYLLTPRVFSAASTKVIINCHGRGDTAYKASILVGIRPHLDALLSAGYAIYSIDHARINSWGDPDAMRALDDAMTYLQSVGFSTTNIGMMGLSMGGQTCLNFIKRHPTQVKAAWLWNPVTDLRFFHDTSAQYTPSYSIGGATQAPTGWPAEIEATYAPSTTANGAQTINGSGGPDSTLNVAAGGAKGFADGHNNAVTGKPTLRVNSTNCTYTGKTDNSLTGVRNIAVTAVVVTNAQAVTGESPLPYTTQRLGYSIRGEEAQWAGITTKIMVCQASDDTVVAPGMNANDANGFVGRVNSSNVTLRSPIPTGGHVGVMVNVPTNEVVDFYLANF